MRMQIQNKRNYKENKKFRFQQNKENIAEILMR